MYFFPPQKQYTQCTSQPTQSCTHSGLHTKLQKNLLYTVTVKKQLCCILSCVWVWPQHLIHITSNVFPGRAAGEISPSTASPAMKSINCCNHICLLSCWCEKECDFWLNRSFCLEEFWLNTWIVPDVILFCFTPPGVSRVTPLVLTLQCVTQTHSKEQTLHWLLGHKECGRYLGPIVLPLVEQKTQHAWALSSVFLFWSVDRRIFSDI